MAHSGKDNIPHILTASSTLLGLCFVVLTSLRITDSHESSLIDELTTAAIIMFMISSIFSYLSMRNSAKPQAVYEKIADIVFLSGLGFLFITTMLIAFNVIN